MKILKQNKKAFTLVELLVTLFIIGAITSLSVIVFDVSWSKSRDNKRISDIIRIQNILESYHRNEGRYPDSITFGGDLISSSSIVYMLNIPINPSPRDDGDCLDEEYQYGTSTDLYGNENFYIEFCVGANTDQIIKGQNCATNQGITSGACNFGNLKSGLRLWLKADGSLTSHFLNGNDYVEEWNDESGSENDIIQTDSDKKPTIATSTSNGQPGVRFDGTNDYLSGGDILNSFNSGRTIYVVGKSNAADGAFVTKAMDASEPGNYGLFYDNSNILYLYQNIDGNYNVTATSTAGVYQIVTTESNEDLQQNNLYLNNILVGTTDITSWQGLASSMHFLVGATNNSLNNGETLFLDGDINEILIYDRILNDIEKNEIYNYLQSKYGL